MAIRQDMESSLRTNYGEIMKVKPVNGYILCKRYKEPERKAGSLVLTTPKHYESWWIVLDDDAIDSNYEIGDTIQIKRGGYANVEWLDDMALVHPDNVLAIIEMGEK